MTLSGKYIILLVVGWASFGGVSYICAHNYIGGAATFFLLVSFASWSIFPLLHFCVAALTARNIKRDPSHAATIGLVFGVLIFLAGVIGSGLFNYV